MMSRADILAQASRIVTKDRAATHGAAEDSFALIGALWSVWLGQPVSSVDVAVMMDLLKTARIKANPGHADNWIDKAGYAACGGEIALRKDGQVPGIKTKEQI